MSHELHADLEERVLTLIKPYAVEDHLKIHSAFRRAGLRITRIADIHLTPEKVAALTPDPDGPVEAFAAVMTTGFVIAAVVEGESAIEMIRTLDTKKFVYVSGSTEVAEDEIEIIFKS